MTTKKHTQLLNNFIQELNEEKFYDAHESLEKIWFPRRFEDDDEVKLLKGFINAAVSFELMKKGRAEASDKIWKNYLKYKPIMHKIDSQHLSDYHTIILHIEKTKSKLNINLPVV